MTVPISAVTFDIGGVLVDWNPRHLYRKLFGPDEAAMESFLAQICTPEWNTRLDAGRPFSEAVEELVAVYPDKADLITAYQVRWPEMLGSSFDGTLAIVRELRAAGYPTYALSNWARETFDSTRHKFAFLDEMDGILISGDVHLAKPDPAIFREFLRKFALDPAATVYIDDWDRNVAAAASMGMAAIHFTDSDRLRRDLRALGLPLAAEPIS
jgi:2-haloacid dehalogenase